MFTILGFVGLRVAAALKPRVEEMQHTLEENREIRRIRGYAAAVKSNTARWNQQVAFDKQIAFQYERGHRLTTYSQDAIDMLLNPQTRIFVDYLGRWKGYGATDQSFWDMMDPRTKVTIRPIKGNRLPKFLPGHKPQMTEEAAARLTWAVEAFRDNLWTINNSVVESFKFDDVSRDISVVDALKSGAYVRNDERWKFDSWANEAYRPYPQTKDDLVVNNAMSASMYILTAQAGNGHNVKLPKDERKIFSEELKIREKSDAATIRATDTKNRHISARRWDGFSSRNGETPKKGLG
ncbi:hypothetical protein [Nocardiopsis sp. Huas11]|uniref:hypothetical protein n=1 Tax=Nocardiopsis sp. Huas11 TaxID=2183912 RepID=UPI0011C3CAFD|nr:hypothetical protein [Nocardiopsis sp. Huas11]